MTGLVLPGRARRDDRLEAQRIGADAGPSREAAAGLHTALISRLWNHAGRRFAPLDLRSGLLVDSTTLSLAPLLDPALSPEMVRAVAADLESRHFRSPQGIGGQDAAADRLDATTMRLVEHGGMREYLGPLTGEGRGSEDCSWTAALGLDILRSDRV